MSDWYSDKYYLDEWNYNEELRDQIEGYVWRGKESVRSPYKSTDPEWEKTDIRVRPCAWNSEDVYFLEQGTKPLKLAEFNSNSGRFLSQYLSGATGHGQKDYLYLGKPTNKEEEKEMNTTKLYQVIGKEVYGTHVGTNSEGKMILEIKGDGGLKAYDKKDIEEVVPYSVGIKFAGSSTVYNYWADKGTLEKGDIIITNDNKIVRVHSVDTKSSSANKRIVGTVLTSKAVLT